MLSWFGGSGAEFGSVLPCVYLIRSWPLVRAYKLAVSSNLHSGPVGERLSLPLS